MKIKKMRFKQQEKKTNNNEKVEEQEEQEKQENENNKEDDNEEEEEREQSSNNKAVIRQTVHDRIVGSDQEYNISEDSNKKDEEVKPIHSFGNISSIHEYYDMNVSRSPLYSLSEESDKGN